ncbi:hypothetical protein [Pseudochryseolinea flava]|uniref:Uncharacterized protein n=1 Tax=Pseudochryseolinea flava TaxID=2059302 RepID=A0A364XYE3_9BACT|nr:hypothetical protein [Pseudochryseolinea flava]RAV98439.1 hypothetical protein DQQ10_24245 [Pseudochryseolinea flava]
MITRITSLITVLILTIACAHGQAYEPLALAKKIFDKDTLSNIATYVIGEYKGRPHGGDLGKGAKTRFMLLEQTAESAVVNMTVLDSTGVGFDTYLHFKKETIWKMSAFRALAQTGIIDRIKTQLEKMSQADVDRVVAEVKKNGKDKFSMFSSQEEYNFLLGNAKLTLALDDHIVQHFVENMAVFEQLKDLAIAELKNKKNDEEGSIKLIAQSKREYERLFIARVSSGGDELGNGINFFIGGVIDNAVGYIYVQDKKDLPRMSPNGVIMIREIGAGWYIYKTT